MSGLCIICSSNFPGSGNKEIGLSSFGLVAKDTFGIGTTVAIFHLSGYIPSFTIWL